MKISMVLLALLFSFQSMAKSSLKIAAGDWPPFMSKKGLAHLGVGVHVVTKAFEKVGIKVKYKFLPWAKGMTEAKKGKKVDGAILWLKNKDREKIFEYSTQ
ncbi:MAG: amino acid ABC transporter substrate-binding protein, partial [Bdellovibrionota bacterium]|nr:amino acid ABC transporter substrate-binding protein [Bdellovibrionota bacterium]